MSFEFDPVDILASSSLDDTWAAGVQGLPATDRAALLLAADGEREGEKADASYACYRALADTLDVRSPTHRDRIAWTLHRIRGPDPAIESLARRALSAEAGTDLANRASLLIGLFALNRNDDLEAEDCFRVVLSTSCGTGSSYELSAALNLAQMSLYAGREFEAVMLSRRAAELAEAAGDDRAAVYALCHHAGSLMYLSDWDRFDPTLRRAFAALEPLPEEERAPLEWSLHSYGAEAGLRRGDAVQAREEFDALTRISPSDEPLWEIGLLAELSLIEGRTGDARSQLDRLDEEVPGTPHGVRVRLAEIRCRIAEERLEDAREEARIVVSVLSVGPRESMGPSDRLRLACVAGKLLEDELGELELARDAYDAAGAAAIERMREIEKFVRNFPDQGPVRAQNREILAEYRMRFGRRHRDVLSAIVRNYARAQEAGQDPLPTLALEQGVHRTCAWCASVMTADRAWLPILPYLSEGWPVPLTHGICPDCKSDLKPG